MELEGKTYRLTHPAVPDALIDEEEFDRDERLPYWAELWPSATALARSLAREDLKGRRAVELGCGVGLGTIAAMDRNAHVLATDYYAAALDFTRHNARENVGHEPETALLNWRAPDTANLGPFDLVFAADVLYEESSARALAELVPTLLAPDGEMLVADPGRRYEPLFRELMKEAGFAFDTAQEMVETEKRDVKVVMHRIRHR